MCMLGKVNKKMYEVCKLCNKEVSMMDGRKYFPNFYHRSTHLRMKHNMDTSGVNVADYFEFRQET